MDTQHRQSALPPAVSFLTEFDIDRGIAIAVALDLPPEAHVLDSRGIDNKPLRHNLVHFRPDVKTHKRRYFTSLTAESGCCQQAQNRCCSHKFSTIDAYIVQNFHIIKSLCVGYGYATLAASTNKVCPSFQFQSLQGARLGRQVIRLASSSPMKRSALGSHFSGLSRSIAILPR